MKSKNREVGILLILLAIFLLYGFYSLLLSPLLEKNRELENQIVADDTVIWSMYGKIAGYENKHQTLQETQKNNLTLAEMFYIREVQETYLNYLDAMLTESGLKLESISALENESFESDAEGYRCEDPYTVYAEQMAGADPEELDMLPKAETMEIKVEATGKYSAAKQFLEKLASSNKQNICNKMSLEFNAESVEANSPDPEGRLTATLSFLRIIELDCLEPDSDTSEDYFQYLLPQEFVSGSYRELYSLDNVLNAGKELVATIRQLFH